ncbi:hypothetical protein D3C72_951550 [compost metagenome]
MTMTGHQLQCSFEVVTMRVLVTGISDAPGLLSDRCSDDRVVVQVTPVLTTYTDTHRPCEPLLVATFFQDTAHALLEQLTVFVQVLHSGLVRFIGVAIDVVVEVASFGQVVIIGRRYNPALTPFRLVTINAFDAWHQTETVNDVARIQYQYRHVKTPWWSRGAHWHSPYS